MYVDSEWRSTIQALIGETSSGFTSGYGPTTLRKRPVRSRMRGVVGAGGEKPPATRLYTFHAQFYLGARCVGIFFLVCIRRQ